MRSCKLVLKDPGILLCRLDSYLGYSWLYSWGWGCLLSPDCLAQMLAFCLSCQTSFQYVVAPALSILKIEFCPDILMSLCNVFSIQMGSVVLNIQMSIQSSNGVPCTSILIVTIVFFLLTITLQCYPTS
jgi:hypothetical protein